MMASKYWLKLYYEMLDDPKVGMLTDRLFRRFIQCLIMAGENDKDGLLPPIKEVCWRLRPITTEELETDYADLASSGLLHMTNDGWVVTNFAKRQAPVSDAERMRRFRERTKKEEYYASDTNTVTTPVTIRNTDIDIDIDKEDYIEANDFDVIQGWLETIAGLPPTPADIPAIQELASLGICKADIRGALQWRKDTPGVKPALSIKQLKNGIITNRNKRIQNKNARKPKTKTPATKRNRNQRTPEEIRADLARFD